MAALCLAGLCLALPSAAQQGTGGSGGGGGSGGSGTGGSGTGGSGGGTGGSSMTGAGGAVDDPGSTCNFAAHTECPDRCPMFATCFVPGSMGKDAHLYYRVEDTRFECDGLNCDSAVQQLGDYCCERGEFAPKDDDGGCALPPGGTGQSSASDLAWLALGLGLCASAVGRQRRRRARTQ